MNRMLIGAVLAMVATGVNAEDLFCSGTSYHRLGSTERSVVVQFDPSTLKLATSTFNGWAEGTMRATPELYLGYLHSSSGARYWINFNRYTGEFLLGPSGDDVDKKMEFVGFCRRAERQF